MIKLANLQKVIASRTVVDIPALQVGAGEVAALVGPQGSGLAELLELLTGHLQPSMGEVRIAGLDPFDNQDRLSRSLGVLFADDGLYARMSARENLLFHCRLYGLPPARTAEVLAQVGLGDHAGMRVDRLGSGMQRRLALGRSLLHHPMVLLLVEPFARCDQVSIEIIATIIRQLAAGERAVLLLGSEAAPFEALCDQVYHLEGGRVGRAYRPGDEPAPPSAPFKIPVRLEGKVALVNPVDILYADVSDGRAYLHTSGDRLPTQFTLIELEERLARSGFFRAHRAYLVNLQHVTEVIPYTRDSFSLRLDDPARTEIPLSKTAAAELRELLGY